MRPRARARHGTKNLEAYELLLKGRALQTKRGRFLPEAIACFEQAIALDPQYAEAMAWLSDSYRLMGTFGVAPFDEVMPRAREIAERALEIDNTLAEAWATLACVAEQYDRNLAEGEKLWAHVFELDPRHARARAQRALWAFTMGIDSADDAVAEAARGVLDDPLNAWVVSMHSHMLGFVGRHEESLVEAERALAIDPESFFAQWNLMRAHAWMGHQDRAIALAPGLLNASGRHHWALGTLAWTYGANGQADKARAIYDELEARSRIEFLSPFWLSVAAASAELPGDAARLLLRAVNERDPLVYWSRVIPACDGLRALPDYHEITRELWP